MPISLQIKGLEFFLHTGICPDMAVGDFDSLSDEGEEFIKAGEHRGPAV